MKYEYVYFIVYEVSIQYTTLDINTIPKLCARYDEIMTLDDVVFDTCGYFLTKNDKLWVSREELYWGEE